MIIVGYNLICSLIQQRIQIVFCFFKIQEEAGAYRSEDSIGLQSCLFLNSGNLYNWLICRIKEIVKRRL